MNGPRPYLATKSKPFLFSICVTFTNAFRNDCKCDAFFTAALCRVRVGGRLCDELIHESALLVAVNRFDNASK